MPHAAAFEKRKDELTVEDLALAREALEELFATRPAAFWEELLQAGGVPCSLWRHPAEWLDCTQPRACGALRTVDLPQFGEVTGIGSVVTVVTQ